MDFKNTRQNLGLNIRQMAEAMGIHRQTWVKWERKEQCPPATAVRFLELLLWLHGLNMLDAYLSTFNVKNAHQRV